LVAAILLAIFVVHRDSRICKIEDDTEGTGFLFGGGIFLGCFLLLQTNYAYRLIFLLLCLPQLFDWIEKGVVTQSPVATSPSERISGQIAWLLLGSCIVTMWLKLAPAGVLLHPFQRYFLELRLMSQIADWILVGTLTAIFVANGLHALVTAWRTVKSGSRR
jgi:hypothetical protein